MLYYLFIFYKVSLYLVYIFCLYFIKYVLDIIKQGPLDDLFFKSNWLTVHPRTSHRDKSAGFFETMFMKRNNL